MANYKTSRILPVVLVVVIVIVAIVALVSLARLVFFSDNNSSTEQVTDTSRTALLNTSEGRSVQVTVRGPIVADEAFHSYRMSVSANQRSITTYNGYLDTVVAQNTLGNNTAAYEQFVYALDKANLAKGTAFEGEQNDIRGICAGGRVYEFSILNGAENVKTLWTSTCNGSRGSLDASVNQLTGLFNAQIPDATNLIRAVNL